MHYATFDSAKIKFGGNNAGALILGKIEVYPYAYNPNMLGEVYFHFCWSKNSSSVIRANYFDPYNLFGDKEFAFIIDNSNSTGILSIPRAIVSATYKIEAYQNNQPAYNLISDITTVPSASAFVDSTRYSIYTNLSSDADTGRYNVFSKQTIVDRLSGKTINAIVTSATNDNAGHNLSNTYIANLTSEIANSGTTLKVGKGNNSLESSIFIQTNQVFQSATTSSDNTNYSLLLAASDSTSSVTGTTNKNNSLTYNPSASTLTTPNLSVSNSAYLSELTASTLSVNGQAYFANTPTVGEDSVQLATKRYYNTVAVGSRSLYVKIKQPNENTKGQFNGNIKLYQYGNSIPPKVGDIPFDIYYNSDSNTYQNGYYYDQFNNVFSSMSLIVPSSFGQNEEPYVYLAVPYIQYGVYAVDCYKTFTTGNSGDNLVLDMSASTAPPNIADGNYATFSLAKITAPIYNGQTV